MTVTAPTGTALVKREELTVEELFRSMDLAAAGESVALVDVSGVFGVVAALFLFIVILRHY